MNLSAYSATDLYYCERRERRALLESACLSCTRPWGFCQACRHKWFREGQRVVRLDHAHIIHTLTEICKRGGIWHERSIKNLNSWDQSRTLPPSISRHPSFLHERSLCIVRFMKFIKEKFGFHLFVLSDHDAKALNCIFWTPLEKMLHILLNTSKLGPQKCLGPEL